ncbi:helix-turn-helix transcriptional regulator [Actinomadura kijaniata]|uniref:Transcriptional regulator with XRE-family HTH domain n=1 Tax=Actinomadura namibiensis TaxID=182080 RepID=A0A7W3QQ26_ACTNM|nr:helix-turn-helix transcriptional regulator [Actinomadura namibiensis]MBA8955211.1 transcriptional regulator with XRE-family HTH domain [Actinomadura namibiensis]
MSTEGRGLYRRRRIGIELRRIREERELTQESAARLLGRSQASLSEYENGRRAIRPRDLAQILDGYGVTDDRLRAQLLDLADKGRRDGWWRGFEERLDPNAVDYASLEGDASRISAFEPQLVHGLLQEEYARTIIKCYVERLSPSLDCELEVDFRMRRQRVLRCARPPHLAVVLGEGALHLEVGGPVVMRAQLDRLLGAAAAPNIDLRVLPFKAGMHPGTNGAFSILDVGVGRNELQVVTVHSLTMSQYIDDAENIGHYRSAFDSLRELALPQADSVALIERIASSYA